MKTSSIDLTLEELTERQQERFKKSAKADEEAEERRLAQGAERKRQAYLVRTGRKELKP